MVERSLHSLARRMYLWLASVLLYYVVVLATAPAGKLNSETLVPTLIPAAGVFLFLVYVVRRAAGGEWLNGALCAVILYGILGTAAFIVAVVGWRAEANALVVGVFWGVQLVAAVWATRGLVARIFAQSPDR